MTPEIAAGSIMHDEYATISNPEIIIQRIIESTVCAVWNVPVDYIHIPGNARKYSAPRQVCVSFIAMHANVSPAEIMERYGMHRTSYYNCIYKVECDIISSKIYKIKYEWAQKIIANRLTEQNLLTKWTPLCELTREAKRVCK